MIGRFSVTGRLVAVVAGVLMIVVACSPPPDPMPFEPGTWVSRDGEYFVILEADGEWTASRLPAHNGDFCPYGEHIVEESSGRWTLSGDYRLQLIPLDRSAGIGYVLHLIRPYDWSALTHAPCGYDHEVITLTYVGQD